MAKTESRWCVVKDYITEQGDNCQDTWVVVYGTEQEAETCKAELEAGRDRTWFDPSDDSEAFLYVELIEGFSASPY